LKQLKSAKKEEVVEKFDIFKEQNGRKDLAKDQPRSPKPSQFIAKQ